VLRATLLRLSENGTIRRWMETSPTADRLTSRFVAGHAVEQEIAVIERLSGERTLATVDYLGEGVKSIEEAAKTRDAYLAILDRVARLGVGATISIKLTQFGLGMSGLGISKDVCRDNVDPLVRKAKELGTSVEIDMEQSGYVAPTLEIVASMHARYGCVRSVIQAYLLRSEKDVERLNGDRIPIRLCKGAYKEPAGVAFQKKSEVDRNYVRLVDMMLAGGAYPAVATHDEKMVNAALRTVKDRGIAPDRFEFQMLYGIRRDLQRRLVAEGYRLRLYVPFGDAWYPYFMRRLAERPANLMFLVRNFFRR
jgi:proline dehydrogenase